MAKELEKQKPQIHRMKRYAEADVNDKLIINLRDLSHIMRMLYEGKGSQKQVLIMLNEGGVATQRELTARMGVQPGSASEVISKLESAGLIQRTPNAQDKRTVDIHLTEAGRLLAAEAAAQRKKRHEEMFSCLSEKEKESFLTLMEQIYGDWEKRYLEKSEEE